MSNQHTPGPWRVQGSHEVWGPSQFVASVADSRDAQLIAAAPDMLALLRRAADSLQDYCAEVNGDMNDSLAMEIGELLKKVQP